MTATISPTVTNTFAHRPNGVNRVDIFEFGVRRVNRRRLYLPLNLEVLRQRLGTVATRVWGLLVGLRNRRGIAHPTRAGISRMLGVAVSTIAKALRKLKAVGLIEPMGKIRCSDKNPYSKLKYVWAYAWNVIGFVPSPRCATIRIPRECRNAITEANTWGGRRKGAGRPRNSSVSAYTTKYSLLTHPLRDSPMAGVKDAAHITMEGQVSGSKIEGSGKHVSGWWAWLEKNGVPPFPGDSVVPLVIVPHQPKLPPDNPPEANAKILGAVYREAIKRVHRKSSWAFARGDIRNSKHYPKLCEASKIFIQHSISPTAWVDWHMKSWQEWKGEGKISPVAAIYDPEKIHKWRGWFSKAYDVQGGNALITDSHRDLLLRYRAMRRAIRKVGASAKVEEVLEIVNKYFPDGLYDILVQKAKAESEAIQFRLEDNVRKGKWIW